MVTDTDIRLILEKLDRFEQKLKELEKDIQEMKPSWLSTQPHADLSKAKRPYGALADIPCVFDNLSPEDRMKPMGISCRCSRCSPYCLSVGSLSDAGTAQVWYQGLAGIGDDVEE